MGGAIVYGLTEGASPRAGSGQRGVPLLRGHRGLIPASGERTSVVSG